MLKFQMPNVFFATANVLNIAKPPHEPQPSYPAPQGWLATLWNPLSSGMAGCLQINCILANSGRKKLHSSFKLVPHFVKIINMSIVYLFYKVFIVSKIKVTLINCTWSKAPSKTA